MSKRSILSIAALAFALTLTGTKEVLACLNLYASARWFKAVIVEKDEDPHEGLGITLKFDDCDENKSYEYFATDDMKSSLSKVDVGDTLVYRANHRHSWYYYDELRKFQKP